MSKQTLTVLKPFEVKIWLKFAFVDTALMHSFLRPNCVPTTTVNLLSCVYWRSELLKMKGSSSFIPLIILTFNANLDEGTEI